MAGIPGSIKITGIAAPPDDADQYPTVDPVWGIGGSREVADAGVRDAITSLRRRFGMLVYVASNDTTYQLLPANSSDPDDNSNWVVFSVGAGGGDLHYTFAQNSPSSSWNINHGLGKFPSIRVMDSAGSQIEGDVTDADADNLTIAFSAPFTGTAYLN